MAEGLTIEIKVVEDRIGQLSGQMRTCARWAVVTTAHTIEREWKLSMEGPKHGRTYRIGRISRAASKNTKGLRTYKTAKGNRRAIVGARIHRASAPGEAPAILTGAYHNAIQVYMVGELTAIVAPGALRYPAILEKGGGGLRGPRPAAGPAAEKARPAFEAAMRSLLG